MYVNFITVLLEGDPRILWVFLNEQKGPQKEMPNRKLKQKCANVKYLTLYCM